MQGEKQKKINKVVHIIGSQYFFWVVITFFVFQAVWVALSFRYSMLYDEYYHFGLINYFSHQWSPWINNQPVSLDIYGALSRNPYLLYHYIMSFPLRLMALFIDYQQLQIILLRLINVGLFTGGLVVFNKLLKEINIKVIFRNIALLFFILLPVTSFVAATINYDNAIFLLSAIFMLLGVRIMKSDKLEWHNYILMLLVGMSGSLMKISFLPIFAAGFMVVMIRKILISGKAVKGLYRSFKHSKLWLKIVIVVPFIMIGFLFIERFGVNVIKYHNIWPSCETQMTKDRCLKNVIEARADALSKNKTGTPIQVPFYTTNWLVTMEKGLLLTGANTNGISGTKTGQPLPITFNVVFFGSIISVAAFFYGFDKIRRINGFYFLSSIIVLYILALFYLNISDYYRYYQLLAIQGRYLLPLLPIIMVYSLLGINYAFIKLGRFGKIISLIVVFALYLNGAGLIAHIIRSDSSWDWNNQTVRKINDEARGILKPFVKEWWYDR